MSLEFIDLNSQPVVVVNCETTEKLWGNKNGLERSTKNDNKELRKKTTTK